MFNVFLGQRAFAWETVCNLNRVYDCLDHTLMLSSEGIGSADYRQPRQIRKCAQKMGCFVSEVSGRL